MLAAGEGSAVKRQWLPLNIALEDWEFSEWAASGRDFPLEDGSTRKPE